MPGEALTRKLKKDVSFALRRGAIAQVTTALDATQRAAEDELALNEAGWDARQPPLVHSLIKNDDEQREKKKFICVRM